MYDGNILHCKECFGGVSCAILSERAYVCLFCLKMTPDTLRVTVSCSPLLYLLICIEFDWWLIVCEGLCTLVTVWMCADSFLLLGMGRTLLFSLSLSFFQLLFSMQSQSLWPLTGYAMQNAWAALCRVKLCVRVRCLHLKSCVWDSALCGWAVARSRSPSLCLSFTVGLSFSLSGAVEDGRSEMNCQFYVSSCHVGESPVPCTQFNDMHL